MYSIAVIKVEKKNGILISLVSICCSWHRRCAAAAASTAPADDDDDVQIKAFGNCLFLTQKGGTKACAKWL